MSYKYVQRGLTLIGLSVASLLASAQTAAPTPPASDDAAEEELLPEVSITGSRIRKDAYTSASPVQIITSERSTLEGLSDTAQVLQESAVASGSGQINTLFGGYLVDGGPGVQTLSLRGLGAQRTLILLNGRRLPPAGVGGTVGPVDLNIIPNSIVNRIELLKDGASSIYGSDAVAGVVNVITKTRASGGRINGQFNATPDGADTYTVDGTWGWAGESGGLSVSAEWYKINQLKLGERPRAACGLDLLTADVAGNVGAIARYGIPAHAVQPGDSPISSIRSRASGVLVHADRLRKHLQHRMGFARQHHQPAGGSWLRAGHRHAGAGGTNTGSGLAPRVELRGQRAHPGRAGLGPHPEE